MVDRDHTPSKAGAWGAWSHRERVGRCGQRARLPARWMALGPVCAGLRAALPAKPRLWGLWGAEGCCPLPPTPGAEPAAEPHWHETQVASGPVRAGKSDARVQAGWGVRRGSQRCSGGRAESGAAPVHPYVSAAGAGLAPFGPCFDSWPGHVASVLSRRG